MYEISIQSHFDSAHYLRGYQGKCENLHGHRYQVVVSLRTDTLNAIGLAYDFTDLKRHLKVIIDYLDHKCLNDLEPFLEINPSAENISRYIYDEIEKKLGDDAKLLAHVRVWESPDSWATYSP